MTCRMGPVRNQRHIAMFGRVEVHPFRMAHMISLVPNSMLPKTPLPQIHRERTETRSAEGKPSWNNGCQMPRSPFAIRIDERPSVGGSACTKWLFDCFNAIGKSIVPGGRW
jgi:hypothetical protein